MHIVEIHTHHVPRKSSARVTFPGATERCVYDSSLSGNETPVKSLLLTSLFIALGINEL